MKKSHKVFHKMTLVAIAGIIAVSCSTDNVNPNANVDQELTQAELKTILDTDEIAGAVDLALAEMYNSSGVTAKAANECYEAVYTETGFTATFNNCVLNSTENMNGSLSVVYAVGSETAAFTATFTDFYVGDIKVNGTRSYSVSANTEQSSIEFSVSSEIELIFPDESVIEQNGIRTVVFTIGETTSIAIRGSWTLVTDGTTYVVEVTEDLIADVGCANLVSGLLYVGKNGLAVTVDFGDGTCDNIATVIYPNEATEEIILDN